MNQPKPEDLPDCFYRISVKALIWDESKTKILLFQERDGEWELPGGGLEFGATPAEELRRELDEEAGLKAKSIADSPSVVVTSVHDKFGYWIANIAYDVMLESLDFTPTDECVAIQFHTPAEILEINAFTNVKCIARKLIG